MAIGRYADPEEVAEVVAFLASERNTYMSGGIVPVDGGRLNHAPWYLRHVAARRSCGT